MALTGEYIASDLTVGFLEPGSVTNYFDLSAYVNEDSMSLSRGEAETTGHGTTARTYIPGLKDGEYSFTIMFNTVPAYAQQPQHRLFQLFDNGTATTWRVREKGVGTGLPEMTFSAFISGFEPDYANDDQPVSASVSLKISGAVTRSSQS
jgi:hypothetical protein